ncbi:MAG: hypothetical protein M3486_01575 [Actinomycetota bacterium]|nr:hypothetical protein [Actinomycetota bacterium]
MNRKLWAPVGAVAATLAVVAAAALLTTDGRPAAPPVLRIVGAGSADSSLAAAPPSRAHQLVENLPEEPSEAAVRDLRATAAPVGAVRALSAALGESAAPVRTGDAWTAGDLRVTDEPGNPWTWGPFCDPQTTVSSDSNRSSACASETVQALPVPPGGLEGIDLPASPPAPEVVLGEPEALAATVAVREALHLRSGRSRVEGAHLIIEPVAGGLPTSGLATRLQLSTEGRLLSAAGWLSTGVEGDTYPLRSARQALDDLSVFALGAPCDATGCPGGPVITGARLGLSLVAMEQGAALVPAWLFDVKGSPVPLVALAVADRFLGQPDPAVVDPGTDPGGGEPGGRGTEPGGIEPAPGKPSNPEPGTAGPDPVPPLPPENREMFSFDAAYADRDPMVLVVRYGDSGSCPSRAVQHSVMEEPDRLIVILSRTPAPADLACTSDYQAKLVPVALQQPLAGREVFDGSRKEPVPVSTGSPPFG